MSKNIGLHDKITVLNLGNGIELKFTLNLGLACPVMHKSLFKSDDAEVMMDDIEADIKGKLGEAMADANGANPYLTTSRTSTTEAD